MRPHPQRTLQSRNGACGVEVNAGAKRRRAENRDLRFGALQPTAMQLRGVQGGAVRHTAAYLDIKAPRWGPEERAYQTVKPRKPYVYGTGRNNALMHVVRCVRLRWWTAGPRGA